jgi:Flp pilus assembly protein TadG
VTDRGQATVEFALCLPLVVVLVLLVLQVAIVVRQQLAVDLAAREAARAAAVSGAPEQAARAAVDRIEALAAPSVEVSLGPDTVAVTVSHTVRTDMPIVGAVLRDVSVSGTATMALEPPGDP